MSFLTLVGVFVKYDGDNKTEIVLEDTRMNVFLKNRQFRALALSAFLSQIGSVLFDFVFLVYAQTLPYATTALSLVAMANMVPNFFMILSGYMADQTNPMHRLPALLGLRIAQGGLYLLLALMIGHSATQPVFWGLLLINITSDLIADYTSNLVLHYEKRVLTTQEDYQDAIGFTTGMGSIIRIVFQALGASLIVLLNHNYAFFGVINAVSFVLAGAVLLRDRRRFKASDQAATDEWQQQAMTHEAPLKGIWTSFKIVVQNRAILNTLILAVLVNTLGSSIDGLTSVLLAEQKALWFGSFGTTVAVISVVSSTAIIVAALFMHDGLQHVSLPALIAVTMISLTVFALNMVIWQNRYVMVVMMATAMYPIGKVNPRISGEIMTRVDSSHLAATASVLQTFCMIGAPVGTATFLGIANWINPVTAWRMYAGAVILVAIIAVVMAITDAKHTGEGTLTTD